MKTYPIYKTIKKSYVKGISIKLIKMEYNYFDKDLQKQKEGTVYYIEMNGGDIDTIKIYFDNNEKNMYNFYNDFKNITKKYVDFII